MPGIPTPRPTPRPERCNSEPGGLSDIIVFGEVEVLVEVGSVEIPDTLVDLDIVGMPVPAAPPPVPAELEAEAGS